MNTGSADMLGYSPDKFGGVYMNRLHYFGCLCLSVLILGGCGDSGSGAIFGSCTVETEDGCLYSCDQYTGFGTILNDMRTSCDLIPLATWSEAGCVSEDLLGICEVPLGGPDSNLMRHLYHYRAAFSECGGASSGGVTAVTNAFIDSCELKSGIWTDGS